MVSKTLVTSSEPAPEHLINPFEDPQIHKVEMIVTRVADDLIKIPANSNTHFECLKSLCSQSAQFRDFARLCELQTTVERLRAEIASTRKSAKEHLVAPVPSEEVDDTIIL
jgi:hypothetical protein